MKEKFKSLGLGLSATTISMLPSLLPTASAACTGICGFCGGNCAGLIVGLGAGGLIFFNRLINIKKESEIAIGKCYTADSVKKEEAQ